MMTWLRKHNREILIFTLGTFLFGGVIFTGAMGFTQTSFSPVAVVNGEKIPYKRFETRINQHLAMQETVMDDEKRASLKASTFQELVQETAFLQEAARYKIVATDAEVAAFLRSIPAFQREGRFDPNLYAGYLQQLRTTPEIFEEDRRQDIRRQKLMMILSSSIRVSEGEVKDHLARLPEKERREIGNNPEQLRQTVAQRQGNAVFQSWIQQVNARLKLDNRLDRWEGKEGV